MRVRKTGFIEGSALYPAYPIGRRKEGRFFTFFTFKNTAKVLLNIVNIAGVLGYLDVLTLNPSYKKGAIISRTFY